MSAVELKDYHGADFCLKSDTPWAEAGHIVAEAEKIVHETVPDLRSEPGKDRTGFAALFKPSLFRVPTENDGLKTHLHLRGRKGAEHLFQADKAFFSWLDLDLLHIRSTDEKTENLDREGSPAIRYQAVLMAGENAAACYKDRILGTYTRITVIPNDDSPLILDIRFDLDARLPELPKVGVYAQISARYRDITWFGSGPHESYPDRKDGAFLGLYKNTITELETPYIVPQENGNRTGVRFITLSGKTDTGKPESYTIRSDIPINFSVCRYTRENMLNALHTSELEDTRTGKGCYTLNIDRAQRGVGNGYCGPDTREEYRVRPGQYRMKLFIV